MSASDRVIKKETGFIAVWELILSAAMEAVFLIIGKWDYTVLLGNLLSGSVAVLNFYLMSITVRKTLEKEQYDEQEARSFAKLSQTMRSFMLFGAAIIGATVPCFNLVSALVPLLFPRIAAWIRVMFIKDETPAESGSLSNDDGGTERGENV